jgi:hypothetical protein
MKLGNIILVVLLTFAIVTLSAMVYGSQVTAVKSCVVTSTYVPLGASHVNAHTTCQDGSTVDAVWALKVGCEPRVGDKVTVTFYRMLWLPQLSGDQSC